MLQESPLSCAPLKGTPSIFTPSLFALLDPTRIPKHIAIIPDGNRRWSKKHLFTKDGHQEGVNATAKIIEAAQEIGIQVLTFYTFSTENWLRSPSEIEGLMRLLEHYLIQNRDYFAEHGIKVSTIGSPEYLPDYVLKALKEAQEATAHCNSIALVLALNYGGRDEIRRSILSIIEDIEKGRLKKEDLDEGMIGKYFDTAGWGDPDLLIRTSGEMRVSNFLLWQISYSEIYISDVLWPDFKPDDFLKAILEYQRRQRRGGT